MNSIKTFGHTAVVSVLWILSFIVAGHVPSLSPYLDLSIGTVLSFLLTWAYAHFGIVPSVVAAVKARQAAGLSV